MTDSIINLRCENKSQVRKIFILINILINMSVFHSDSTVWKISAYLQRLKKIFPISYFCIMKYFFSISLKSGRRPLKRWRSVQVPCRYEKAIFCPTEAETNYRYFQVLNDMVIMVIHDYLPSCIPFSHVSMLNTCQCFSSHYNVG